jgi:hypothetical protein
VLDDLTTCDRAKVSDLSIRCIKINLLVEFVLDDPTTRDRAMVSDLLMR